MRAMTKLPFSTGSIVLSAVVLLALAGGTAVGIYFAVRNNSKENTKTTSDLTTTDGKFDAKYRKSNATTPASSYAQHPATEKSGTVNFASRNDPISRQDLFYGLTYSPYGLGDNRVCPPYDNTGDRCLLPGQVLADIRTISSLTKRVKLYSLDCYVANQVILEYAKANGMSVMLGVYITSDQAKNDKEISNFQNIANTYGNSSAIAEIVVGNEALFVEGAAVAQLTSAIAEVRAIARKAGISASIGCAEVYSIWADRKDPLSKTQLSSGDINAVLASVDWIGLNAHAYYSGEDPLVQDAGKAQIGSVQAISSVLLAKGITKPVYITETGYPEKGPKLAGAKGSATPSARGMEAFAKQMELAARATGVPTYFFESFNGDWKRRWLPETREVDFNFGLFYCNRSMKALDLPPPGAP